MLRFIQQSEESIACFYNSVHSLREHTEGGLNDFLLFIELSESILDYILIDDNKYCLDTTLTSLISLTNHWHNIHNKQLDIIADNSKQFEAQKGIIDKLSKIKDERLVGYDTRKHTYPLPIHKFCMVDSNNSFGVQIADMIASAVTFKWNKPTKKYEKFHTELSELDFFNLPCYPICPSTSEELLKPVDNSNDIDPLDFLVKNLE